MIALTLRDLIAARPSLFYAPYDAWWQGEDFVSHGGSGAGRWPSGFSPMSPDKATVRDTVCATTLAHAFTRAPNAAVWRHWFWTDDFDRHGQRVYVGVGPDERGFEIHRHLHITERWGVPIW